MRKINVLSLFDGVSCGRVALQRAGIPVNKYYASEIDKYAIMITQNNFPDTIQLGDVTKWEDWDIDWGSIDLLIGGSPCFTAGTLVMTPTGFKNIEDIQVGDYVLTHKSRYRKVLKTGHKQVNTVYNIKGMGLHNLETTQEHPFYIRERYRVWDNENRTYSRLFKAPEWKDANKPTGICETCTAKSLQAFDICWSALTCIDHIINHSEQIACLNSDEIKQIREVLNTVDTKLHKLKVV